MQVVWTLLKKYKNGHFWAMSRHPEYDWVTVPRHNGHDPRPSLVVYSPFCFHPYKKKTKYKTRERKGVQARYSAELPPFISIVRCPGRSVILGMEFLYFSIFFRIFRGQPGVEGALRKHPEMSSQKVADLECGSPYDSYRKNRAPSWPFLGDGFWGNIQRPLLLPAPFVLLLKFFVFFVLGRAYTQTPTR